MLNIQFRKSYEYYRHQIDKVVTSKPAITCSKSTIETLEQVGDMLKVFHLHVTCKNCTFVKEIVILGSNV